MGKKTNNTTSSTTPTTIRSASSESPPAVTPQTVLSNDCTELTEVWNVVSARITCHHGARPDWTSIPHMSTFFQNLGSEAGHAVIVKMFRDMPKDDPGHDAAHIVIQGLAALGTVCLHNGIAGVKPLDSMISVATQTANVMVYLESVAIDIADPELSTADVHRQLDHARHSFDSTKGLVAFFATRIPCHCLDSANKVFQLCSVDTGKCRYCGKVCQDNHGALRDCGGCHMAKYCSRHCQRKHWPTHKKICAKLHQKKQDK